MKEIIALSAGLMLLALIAVMAVWILKGNKE